MHIDNTSEFNVQNPYASHLQGSSVDHASPCYAPAGGQFLPHGDAVLPKISRSPIGSVDTLKLELQIPSDVQPDLGDLLVLRSNPAWKETESKGGSEKRHGVKTRSINPFFRFTRPSDGCQILLLSPNEHGGFRIKVEVSIPRAIYGHNDHQYRVTHAQLRETVQAITLGLFPETSKLAAKHGARWEVCQIDLATNFMESIALVNDRFRQCKHTSIQCAADVFEERGIAWYGSLFDAIIYVTGKRPGRGRLGKPLKGMRFDPEHSEWLRFEFRFKNKKAVARLQSLLGHGVLEAGLGLLPSKAEQVSFKEGEFHHALQRVLALQMEDLQHNQGRGSFNAAHLKSVRDYGIKNLAEHPDDLAAFEASGISLRTRRAVRKEVASYKNVHAVNPGLSMIWDRPRVSSEMRERMVHQVRRDSGLRCVSA